MTSVHRPLEVTKLLQHPVSPSASDATLALFTRVFNASLKPLIHNPDHVKERIDKDRYVTHLFFKDPEQKELTALYSVDKKPFKCAGIEDAMRIHILHTNGTEGLQKPLLLKAVAHAIDKSARAIVFFVTPAANGINRLLKELAFSEHRKEETYRIMVHHKLTELQAQLKERPLPPVPLPLQVAAAAAPPAPSEMPLPRFYKGVTLMKKYLHMIRYGYQTREGTIYKTVEGRINRGMFAERSLPVGSGIRFFYMQNAQDDVQCTIMSVRTFRTFKEMLEHYGYKKLVPDVPNLDAAVAAYARIPGYSQKEKESGVIGIELRVDGHGPDGPAFRQAQPYAPKPPRRDTPTPGSNKRRPDERPDYRPDGRDDGHGSKHYRNDSDRKDPGYGGSRYDDHGRRY